MIKLYVYSRKLHRLLVLIVSALGLVMAGTGVVLRYPMTAVRLLPSIDLGLLRFLHNKISTYFSVTLALMALSGLYMYLHSVLMKRRQAPPPVRPPAGT